MLDPTDYAVNEPDFYTMGVRGGTGKDSFDDTLRRFAGKLILFLDN